MDEGHINWLSLILSLSRIRSQLHERSREPLILPSRTKIHLRLLLECNSQQDRATESRSCFSSATTNEPRPIQAFKTGRDNNSNSNRNSNNNNDDNAYSQLTKTLSKFCKQMDSNLSLSLLHFTSFSEKQPAEN